MLETTEILTPAVVTVPVTPLYFEMSTGSTLRFTNDSHIYTSFEVIFLGRSPSKSGQTHFNGKTEISIPVDVDDSFQYVIRYQSAERSGNPFASLGVCYMKACVGACH